MKPERPFVLGIETSCDDTACAVVDGAGRVLASVVSSQLASHRPFGGVVPEIASREHLSNWPAVSAEAFNKAGIEAAQLDVIAATRGPGLVGCLLVGLSVGRAMAFALGRSFHGVHHVEGHVYSPFLSAEGKKGRVVPERFHALVVSGGHTSLLAVEEGEIKSLVETRDDAMGEVFDKVGKRLGLNYPQGPQVDHLAEGGDPAAFHFTIPKVKGTPGQPGKSFFSYSGLKSQAQRAIEALEASGVLGAERPQDAEGDWPQAARDLLAGFRRAAVEQILHRLERHHRVTPIETLSVAGGVAANLLLRRELTAWAAAREVDLHLVPLVYSGDNAAMIAFAALLRHRRGLEDDPRNAVVASRLPFEPA
jgi:N6-L-threonylcarbamoyladenine synthase